MRMITERVAYVPYLETQVKFAALEITKAKQMIKDINGRLMACNKDLFDIYLSSIEDHNIQLHVIDERCYTNGVRFVLIDHNEMTSILNEYGSNDIIGVSPISHSKNNNGVSPFQIYKCNNGV